MSGGMGWNRLGKSTGSSPAPYNKAAGPGPRSLRRHLPTRSTSHRPAGTNNMESTPGASRLRGCFCRYVSGGTAIWKLAQVCPAASTSRQVNPVRRHSSQVRYRK